MDPEIRDLMRGAEEAPYGPDRAAIDRHRQQTLRSVRSRWPETTRAKLQRLGYRHGVLVLVWTIRGQRYETPLREVCWQAGTGESKLTQALRNAGRALWGEQVRETVAPTLAGIAVSGPVGSRATVEIKVTD